MKIITENNSIPLESFLEIDLDQQYIDLHNDYLVHHFKIDKDVIEIILKNTKSEKAVGIQFYQVTDLIVNLCLINPEEIIFDLFYRGRHEIEQQLYDTYEGKIKIYLSFLPEGELEFLCKRIELNLWHI